MAGEPHHFGVIIRKNDPIRKSTHGELSYTQNPIMKLSNHRYQPMKTQAPRLFIAAILILTTLGVQAQQKPAQRGYLFTGMLWNPALTAPGEYWEAGVQYSQQWLNFPGAPQSGFAYFQLPFVDKNMAAGLVLGSDKAGPLTNYSVQGNYAYKIGLGLADQDQLSIGISARGGQFRFDPNQVVAEDTDDRILTENQNASLLFDYGLGLFYISNGSFLFDRSSFYVGLAVDQLRSQFTSKKSDVPLAFDSHFHFLSGYRFARYDKSYEPAVFLDLTADGSMLGGATFRYERDAEYWLNAGVETDGSMRLGAGWIHNRGRIMNVGGVRSGAIFIGAEAEYGVLSDLARQQGLSFHLYLAYRNQRN